MDATSMCRFCGAVGKMTDEHVFRKKFNNLVPKGPHSLSFEGMHVDPESGSPIRTHRKFKGRIFEQTVSMVCGDCNHGWMESIECAAENTLYRLIRDERAGITRANAMPLARWAVKTALVRELMDPPVTWVGHAGMYRDLREDGIPAGSRVWVLSAERYKGITHRSSSLGGPDGRLLIFTVQIEHMLLLAVVPNSPWAASLVEATLGTDDLDPLFSVWPLKASFGWPTVRRIHNNDLHRLGDEIAAKINGGPTDLGALWAETGGVGDAR